MDPKSTGGKNLELNLYKVLYNIRLYFSCPFQRGPFVSRWFTYVENATLKMKSSREIPSAAENVDIGICLIKN